MADTYATIAPIYIGGAILSFVSCAYAIRMSLKEGKRLFRASPSTLILLLTLLDAAYALKFAVSAVVWYATGSSPDDSRSSFHGINDNCLLSVMYEQLVGMACVCLNACWIFNFVYMLNNPLINTNHHMKWYYVFTVLVSVGTTITTGVTEANASAADHTCWVRSAYSFEFEYPLFLALLAALASLVLAVVRLRKGLQESSGVRGWLFIRHFAFVLAFVFNWAYPAVHQYVDPDNDNITLAILDGIVVSTQTTVLVLVRFGLRMPGCTRCLLGCMDSKTTVIPTTPSFAAAAISEADDSLSSDSSSQSSQSRWFQLGSRAVKSMPSLHLSDERTPLIRLRDVESGMGMGTPMPASPDVHRSASAASMSVLDLSGKLQAEACYAMLCAVCQSVERCDADAAARDALATQGTPYDSESASDMEPAFDNRGKAMPTLKALKSQYKSLKVVCRVRTSAVRPIQSELESRAPTLLGEAVSFKDASFSTFRSQFGISAPLVRSVLSPALASLGKVAGRFSSAGSSSFFCLSEDRSLILKTISSEEMLTLLRFVDAYLSHFLQHPQSFVCRVYGCYELMINGLSSSMCVLLMGNVHQVPKCWCTCAADWAEHSEVYDLKGSLLGRGSKSNGTLDANGKPTSKLLQDRAFHAKYPSGFVVQDSSALSDAQVQLNIDVQFLLRQGLMDYSLLLSVFWLTPEFTGLCPACAVGAIPVKAVDSDRRAFVKFGIIDWLQTYDMSKRIEHGLKVVRHVSMSPDISAVDPYTYSHRFLELFSKVFN